MRDSDAALDPRRPPHAVRPPAIRDADPTRRCLEVGRRAALSAGVAGFVCRDADRLPAPFWNALIDASTTTVSPPRWIAWTPGLARPDVAALIGAGFDTVCSSLAWWDGRAHWLADESSGTHDAAARVLAFPGRPLRAATVRAAGVVDRPAAAHRRSRRRRAAGRESSWRDCALDWESVNRWFAGQERRPAPHALPDRSRRADHRVRTTVARRPASERRRFSRAPQSRPADRSVRRRCDAHAPVVRLRPLRGGDGFRCPRRRARRLFDLPARGRRRARRPRHAAGADQARDEGRAALGRGPPSGSRDSPSRRSYRRWKEDASRSRGRPGSRCGSRPTS